MRLVYHDRVITPPGRQVLRFRAGGVSFALPLSTVREIVPAGAGSGRAPLEGAIPLAERLGLRGEPRFALLLEGAGIPPLLVDRMDGVADLADAEAFRLPERTVAAEPSPFSSALRFGVVLHLELAPAALLTMMPLSPRPISAAPDDPPAERELLAERDGQTLAVPLPLVVHVIDPVELSPVPLAPDGLRGILHHGRAIHPAWDAAHLLGGTAHGHPRVLLLLDAGGTTAGVLVDRVLGLSEGMGLGPVRRPPWDALLAPGKPG
jgi:chemotaxis signal transduction protein